MNVYEVTIERNGTVATLDMFANTIDQMNKSVEALIYGSDITIVSIEYKERGC